MLLLFFLNPKLFHTYEVVHLAEKNCQTAVKTVLNRKGKCAHVLFQTFKPQDKFLRFAMTTGL